MLGGKGNKLVYIRLDGLGTSLHGGYGIALSLQAYALAPYGSEGVEGGTGCASAMKTRKIAAENKNLIILESGNEMWGKSAIVHNQVLLNL